MSLKRKWVIGGFCAGILLDFLLFTSIIPILPPLMIEQHIAPVWIGFIFSSKSLFQLCFLPMALYLIFRRGVGRWFGIFAGSLLHSISCFLFAFTDIFALWVLARALHGMNSRY